MAKRARTDDSVATRRDAWQRWATSEPTAVAPRFALAMLARYDERYRESLAWMDSASARATDARWRNALAREGVVTRLIQGEFTEVPALLQQLTSDTAGVPRSGCAEAGGPRSPIRTQTDRSSWRSPPTVQPAPLAAQA